MQATEGPVGPRHKINPTVTKLTTTEPATHDLRHALQGLARIVGTRRREPDLPARDVKPALFGRRFVEIPHDDGPAHMRCAHPLLHHVQHRSLAVVFMKHMNVDDI